MSRESQSKRWAFTWNNPGEQRPVWAPTDMEYLVYQGERGANGTEHIQGYVRFNRRVRLSQAKRLLDANAIHLAVARGNEEQNRTYCTKEDTRLWGPVEHGAYAAEEGRQGRRTDIKECTDAITAGLPMKEVALRHPEIYVKYHVGLNQFKAISAPLPALRREVQVLCLWGPTGTGKTYRARMAHPEAYIATPGRDPWGLYRGENCVIFDEFDYRRWTIQEMNRYLDVWRCQLDARYNDRYAEWTRVVICSNLDPTQFWPDEPNQRLRQSIFRRMLDPPLGGQVEVLSQMQPVSLFGTIWPPSDPPANAASPNVDADI